MGVLFFLITIAYYFIAFLGVRRGGSLLTTYCNLLIPNTTLFDGSLLLFLHCVTLQLDRYIKYKLGQWPVGESSVLVVGTH